MDAAQKMDKQYLYQRYVYDLTRKYYLLGRDTLLRNMVVKDGETILEIGCGTARNLLKLAYYYPDVNLYGVDASAKMLETAQGNIKGSLYEKRIKLAQGLAGSFTYQDIGLNHPVEHIVFSYVLSMIPEWEDILEHTIKYVLKTGGTIHIVDFSDQMALPSFLRVGLKKWLAWFNVYPDEKWLPYLEKICEASQAKLVTQQLMGNYALLAHLQFEPVHYLQKDELESNNYAEFLLYGDL